MSDQGTHGWDPRAANIFAGKPTEELTALGILSEKIAIMARINELYLAMQTVERYGGCSPEETDTIVRLGDRLKELRRQLAALDKLVPPIDMRLVAEVEDAEKGEPQ